MDNEISPEIFRELEREFTLVKDIKLSTPDVIIYRSDLNSGSEASKFLDKFIALTSTNYNGYAENLAPQKIMYHKTLICHHSKQKKAKNSPRNAFCDAKIDIKIKKVNRNTIKNDSFLKLKPPLPCIIKIDLKHTHNLNTADSFRMLPVSEEVKTAFYEYFQDGLTPSEAKKLHENKLMIRKDFEFEMLAKSSLNPTTNQLYYLHKKWRCEHFGPAVDPLEKLKEKSILYNRDGSTVEVDATHPWAILIVTPVMRRVHALLPSSEIIFLDSTSNCESSKSTVTVLVSATKVGGIPLAVLIHEDQSMESYANAFRLLKKTFPFCFGEKESPDVFMTDDSAAEKGALKSVWPSSKQLLCHFHVGQAEWRWLLSSTSDVPRDKRIEIMHLFKSVMYATSEEDLNSAVKALYINSEAYTAFTKRFSKFFERKEEWLLLFRHNLIIRNHNTNNFCEATIRIIKDIILCRTKALNVVALTDFCINVWDKYLITRLLDHAHNRVRKHTLLYDSLLKKSQEITDGNFQQVSEFVYSVPSSKGTQVYEVNTLVGCCSCLSGKTGAFCKHQCFLHVQCKIRFPNAPVLTCEDRHQLAVLALGEKCPDKKFFLGLTEVSTTPELSSPLSESNNASFHSPYSSENMDLHSPENMDSYSPENMDCDNLATHEDKAEFLKEIERILNVPNVSRINLKKITKQLKSVTPGKVNECLILMGLSLKHNRRKGGKIKVQPTSTARRRKGVTKGSRRIPAGRPFKSDAVKLKRQRNLSLNITLNQANAKSHGSGH